MPRETGLFRIRPDGALTDIAAVMAGPSPGFAVDPTAGPDDFTYRRRMEADTCRIDLDIGQQQRVNGEWVPLVYPLAKGPGVNERTPSHETAPIVRSPAERAEIDRDEQASAHAGNLRQGLSSTFKTTVGFEGSKDCFEAVWIFQVEQHGVTFLFPAGLKAELNRFFIERVDVDADHSTLYLSRGSCRFGFTISASVSRDGSWVPLPIAPPRQTKIK